MVDFSLAQKSFSCSFKTSHSSLWFSMLIFASLLICAFAGLFAIAVWMERKMLGRAQNRYGPNRVGPFGLLQPVADGLKMLTKEDIIPSRADRAVHFIAPIVAVVPVFLSFAVLPLARGFSAVDLDCGLLFFIAVGALREIGIFMAGYASRNKFSLLGALRGIAQMVSYEAPLILATLPVVMVTGTLNLQKIAEAQAHTNGGVLYKWFIFAPWGIVGFILLLTAAIAQANRSPFDLPEGESEIVAGHMVEYSGFKYALFFVGEYLSMFALSGLTVTLYLGSYNPPLAFLSLIPTAVWFLLKVVVLVWLFIWFRATFPRVRPDQLMSFAWKFLIPMNLLNLLGTGLWVWTSDLLGQGSFVRWTVTALVVIGCWIAISNLLFKPKNRWRRYKLAD